ncbi:MAG: PIN domain-containing protein [Treponema sp.]|nr:PIN domain-containing protein [Treponema sp.]
MKDKQIKSAEGKVFFDSNILVYYADESDARKQKIAMALIKDAIDSGNGVISTQCLQEFYNVVTKKLLCDKERAKEMVKMFSDNIPVVKISVPLILAAVDISIKSQFSFWDSLILSAADDTGCATVYSEDLNDQQIVGGARIQNPFAA